VEALQFLKCSYHHNLLFREEVSTQQKVEELNNQGIDDLVDKDEKLGWDNIIEDIADNEGASLTGEATHGHSTSEIALGGQIH
jgi:hypothetical protein